MTVFEILTLLFNEAVHRTRQRSNLELLQLPVMVNFTQILPFSGRDLFFGSFFESPTATPMVPFQDAFGSVSCSVLPKAKITYRAYP